MRTTGVGDRYARALYSVVPKESLDEIATELEAIIALLEEATVARFLAKPSTSYEEKKKIFALIPTSSLLIPFLQLVIAKKRENVLPEISMCFRNLVNGDLGRTTAKIVTAKPLTLALESALKEKLGKLTGKTVTLDVLTDENLWGGITIEVDGRIIDASLSHTLSQMKQVLAQERT